MDLIQAVAGDVLLHRVEADAVFDAVIEDADDVGVVAAGPSRRASVRNRAQVLFLTVAVLGCA